MDLLTETIQKIKPVHQPSMRAVQCRLDALTKPQGSLGRLEGVLCQLGGIAGISAPQIRAKAAILMAGDHGVTSRGVSAYPSTVTVQMLLNFAQGGAAMNVLMRELGGRLYVVDVGVAGDYPPNAEIICRKVRRGTADISVGPAMSRQEAQAALAVGIEMAQQAVAEGAEIIAVGEMGIGNTTPSAALAAFYTGLPVAEVTGRGTGVDEARHQRKIAAIEAALACNQADADDPLAVLAQLGGLEIAALAGVALGAAACGRPVMLDGFISAAAALCAVELAPIVRDYLIASHLSFECGHQAVLAHLGLEPLLSLDMRLGEGTGGALALKLLDSALLLLNEMATFDDAGVDNKLD